MRYKKKNAIVLRLAHSVYWNGFQYYCYNNTVYAPLKIKCGWTFIPFKRFSTVRTTQTNNVEITRLQLLLFFPRKINDNFRPRCHFIGTIIIISFQLGAISVMFGSKRTVVASIRGVRDIKIPEGRCNNEIAMYTDTVIYYTAEKCTVAVDE